MRDHDDDFRAFFDTIDDFLFVLDSRGCILRVNATVVMRLGYNEAELVGRPALVVHPPQSNAEAAALVAEMLAGRRDRCHVPLQTMTGQQIPVETRIVQGRWNGAPALFAVSRDISDQLSVQRQLEEQSEHRRRLLEQAAEQAFFLRESHQVGQLGGWRADPLHNTLMWTAGIH